MGNLHVRSGAQRRDSARLRVLVTLILSITSTDALGLTSAIFDRTPEAGGTCTTCHTDNIAGLSSTGALPLSDTTLKLNVTYELTFTNSRGAPSGFNLDAGGLAGPFEQISDPISITTTNRDQISQNGGGLSSWTFNWTPTAETASEQFSWCTLATNGSGSAGDGPTSCSVSTAFSVEDNEAPTFAPDTLDVVFREIDASRVITGVAATDANTGDTAGLTYAWTTTSNPDNLDFDNIQAPTYQSTGRTVYSVIATDEVGVDSNALTVTVDIDPAPTAVIAGDTTPILDTNSGVTFSGTSSTDQRLSGASTVPVDSYNWTIRRGDNSVFATGSGSTIDFIPPDLGFQITEVFTIELVVEDNNAQTDSATSLQISVSDIAVGDVPPNVSLTASVPQNENTTITLTATATDDNALNAGSYEFNRTSGPAVTLAGTGDTRTLSYDVTDPMQANETFTFEVTVTDSVGQMANDSVTVIVNNGPTANAGTDATVDEGDTVNLDGTGSFDPGGTAIFAWTQESGPAVSLSNAGIAAPSFTAPDVGRAGDSVVFTLTVTDLDGLTDTDTVTITVDNVNAAPSAIAGDDQTVDENTVGTLLGDYTDPDDPGSTITFAWSQSGGAVTVPLSDPTAAQPTFTAPEVAATDILQLTYDLIVTDEGMLPSAVDQVVITIANVNRAPTADAGPDQSVDEGDLVTLNGTNSDDDDDRLNLVYAWSQNSGQPVTFSSTAVPSPTLTAPDVGFDDPVLDLRLTVTDTQGLSDFDDVLINVTNFNVAPIANAGPDQTVNESGNTPNIVTLDGRNSVDPDLAIDDVLSYAWIQTAGALVTLTGADTATPTFAAPSVDEAGLSLTFQTTVTDRGGAADTDSVIVNVVDISIPPVADAGPDQNVNEGVTVSLSGDNSSDVDGSVSSFAWRQTSGPAITLSAPNASNTTFAAPRVTDQASIGLQLTVTDDTGLQGSDDITVNVMDESDEAPVADAGPDQMAAELDTVMLDGSGSFDLDGNIDTVLWSQSQGTGVELSDPTAIAPTFLAPAVGPAGEALVFEILVTDASTLSSSDTVIVNVTDSGQPPIAVAGADQSADEGQTVRLDGSGSTDPFGTTLSYLWQQTAGPNIILSDPSAAQPTFVAPGISAAESGAVATFQLTVTSDALMASDAVNITINDNGITAFSDELPSIATSDGAIAFAVANGNLVAVAPVTADSITEPEGRPETFYGDLVDIEVSVTTPGDTVVVTVLFENPVPVDAGWAKYSSTTGTWSDYSSNVVFAGDGLSAEITLTDGGSGDDDLIADGRIIDPSGPAVFAAAPAPVAPPAAAPQRRSSSGGGCTAVQGGPADPTLPLLVILGILYLLRRRQQAKQRT